MLYEILHMDMGWHGDRVIQIYDKISTNKNFLTTYLFSVSYSLQIRDIRMADWL